METDSDGEDKSVGAGKVMLGRGRRWKREGCRRNRGYGGCESSNGSDGDDVEDDINIYYYDYY